MAITKSAKKAHRASLRKKVFNDARRRALREAIKQARTAAEGLPALPTGQAGGRQGDAAALSAAYKVIDKALKRGIIKKNTAARRKSKVAKILASRS